MINENIVFFLKVYFKIDFAQTENRCAKLIKSDGNSKSPKNATDEQTSRIIFECCLY